jgi:signal transduction histidine kinase
MRHYHLINRNGSVIASNLTNTCTECFSSCNLKGNLIPKCPLYNDSRRQGILRNNKSVTFLCCNRTKTTKLFREKIDGLACTQDELNEIHKSVEENIKLSEQQKVNRLVHNLASINAHNIQEIYDVVPQDILSSNWRDQLDYLEDEIKQNVRKYAFMLIRLAKNNIQMKSEFSIYRKLDRNETAQIELKNHPIRTVLLNVLHTFFGDFNTNSIYVNVDDFYGRVKMDYETIQVALYHFIENATKYAKPNSKIGIKFSLDGENTVMSVTMQSTYVESHERDTIFNEGVSGSEAKKLKKNGDGLGMWRIRQMIQLNQGDFKVEFGDFIDELNDIQYTENVFKLMFKTA